MAAAGKGRMEEAAALLAAGADPAARARDGSTARDWAAKFGHEEAAALMDSHTQVSGKILQLTPMRLSAQRRHVRPC